MWPMPLSAILSAMHHWPAVHIAAPRNLPTDLTAGPQDDFVDRAARARLHEAATPHEIPGWDHLAAGRSFYVAADWLRFADTDRLARSQYLGLSDGGRLVAALSCHWAPAEIDAAYVAARSLELPSEAPSVGDSAPTLGGRRGFLSGVLIAPDTENSSAAENIAELIRRTKSASKWWWPYLLSADVDVVIAAGSKLGGPADLGVYLLAADCVIDVVGETVNDHVVALPTRQRRTNFRREEKRFADSGLEIRRVSLDEHWPRLGSLLAAVQQKYGHNQSASEMGTRLRRQWEHLGSRALVFACFDGDVIVGFALAYQWGVELVLRAVGFDYGKLRGADEYAQLAVHAPLRYCYSRGLRRLHLGTASHEAKCRRGARLRPLWAVTSFPGPDPGSFARRVNRITASMPAHESELFAKQVEQSWRRWTALGA